MSISVRPHRWQPTRLRCPCDSPDKSTGVGCHCLLCQIKLLWNIFSPRVKKFWKNLFSGFRSRWWSRRMELTFPHKHIKNPHTEQLSWKTNWKLAEFVHNGSFKKNHILVGWKKGRKVGPSGPERHVKGRNSLHGWTITLGSKEAEPQTGQPCHSVLHRTDKPPWMLGRPTGTDGRAQRCVDSWKLWKCWLWNKIDFIERQEGFKQIYFSALWLPLSSLLCIIYLHYASTKPPQSAEIAA